MTNYWYQLDDVKCITIDYGRYEAVQYIIGPRQAGCYNFTWTPVLAGPRTFDDYVADIYKDIDDYMADPLADLSDEEYAQATMPV